MKKIYTFLAFLVLVTLSADLFADIRFPNLTGRVVDSGNMLSPESEVRLKALLHEHELKSTNQIVVATVMNLQGYTVEEFGYQLGRHWKIGQKDKNNGVLFLIAKQERKIRIEVGYGLEGTLTDAVASSIIFKEVKPLFKLANFDAGVEAGVKAIVDAIAGEYKPQKKPVKIPIVALLGVFFVVFLVIIILGAILGGGSGDGSGGSGRSGSWYNSGGFSGGGGSSGGGFSGGGGGFGGGGASGGW